MSLIDRLPDEILLQVFRDVVSLDWLDRIERLVRPRFKEQGPYYYRELRVAAGCESDSRCLYPSLFVCKRWVPLARRVLYQGTVHLNIASPKLDTTVRSMLDNDTFCNEVQAFAVDWDFLETDRSTAGSKWSLLIRILKSLMHLRHLVLCPVPWLCAEEIRGAVAQLPLRSLSLVVRDGNSVNIIAYQTSQTGAIPSLDDRRARLPHLVSEAEVHKDNTNSLSSIRSSIIDTDFFSNRLPFGRTYSFNVSLPSQCTGLALRNIRLRSEDFATLVTELAPNLRLFSYHEDDPAFQGIVSPELAAQLLPMLEKVEELHYVPLTSVVNDHDFVPSRLDISPYWPNLRRFVSSDAFVPFRGLTQFLSPHVESAEYHISDTENSSSVRVFQAMIPQLSRGSPARIYLYKAHLRVYINDGYGAPENRATLDWTSGKLYRAKQSCKERNIELRYWKHQFEEIIGIPDTYIEKDMPQGSLAGVSVKRLRGILRETQKHDMKHKAVRRKPTWLRYGTA